MTDVSRDQGLTPEQQPKAKKPYLPPRLIEHGKVSELTAQNGSDPGEEIGIFFKI